MIKIGTDPDNKARYIKLAKNTIIASVLITLSLTLLEIPKSYFGSPIGVADEGTADITFEKIQDKDCQGREVVNIDGKSYVVTKSNAKITALGDNGVFMEVLSERQFTIENNTLENCSILKNFSECQGTFKGYFANTKYYRDSDGYIFPADLTYAEYKERKANGGGGFR